MRGPLASRLSIVIDIKVDADMDRGAGSHTAPPRDAATSNNWLEMSEEVRDAKWRRP